MRDEVSQQRVEHLHPKIRTSVSVLIEAAEKKLGPKAAIRIVQGLRTFAEQDALYAQGRTKPGNRVTNSKGGQSYHNYGLAIDFAILYDKDGNGTFETMSWDTKLDANNDGEADWMEVVDIFERAGFTWGGRFHSITDNPHFEMTFGANWRTMLVKYNNKQFIQGTEYINI
jgi:peptidoglycan L-alanyl-D-glutamate endopeptidase CwlK